MIFFVAFVDDKDMQVKITWCLLTGFFCRNFDEVLSSFAELLLESASCSDSCSGLYDKENFKVSTVILSFGQLSDVTSISEASQLSAINRTKGRTRSTSLTCP